MKSLVVYDSVFGNTEKIALAIGNIIGADVKKISDIGKDELKEVDLLVVGSPTRGFRPTPAITEWIKGISPESLKEVKIASFDTRSCPDDIESKFLKMMMKKFGYASNPIFDALSKKGGIKACDPEGFYVSGSEGPLKDGELERSKEWAENIKK